MHNLLLRVNFKGKGENFIYFAPQSTTPTYSPTPIPPEKETKMFDIIAFCLFPVTSMLIKR